MKVQYRHSIDAKLASNIGEDSVSNPIQAIIELVKNSYDADATEVTVQFDGFTTDKEDEKEIHKITIRDNGYGMTHEDINDKFFRIGTDTKLRKTISPILHRRVVGDKGMGHVASKRLSRICKITSNPEKFDGREFSESIDKTMTAEIDWDQFITGRNFLDILSDGEIIERRDPNKHGLTIELEQLNQKIWTVDDIEQVKDELGLLRLPKILEKKDDKFDVTVEAPDFETGLAEVNHDVLDSALFKVVAKVKNGKMTYWIYKRKKIAEWDKVTFRNETIQHDSKKYDCGDCKFELYNFPADDFFGKQQFGPSIERITIQNFLEDHSGIKIFNDGIRVMPFGEKSHSNLYDWAGLDARLLKSQMGGKIRQDRLSGFVFLTRESNKDITEVSTREGIKEGPAFFSLVQLVKESVIQLEKYKKTERDAKQKTEKTVFHEQIAKNEIENLMKKISKLNLHPEIESMINDHLTRTCKEIDDSDKSHLKTKKKLMNSIDMYRALSTLGISSLQFSHEIGPKFTELYSTLIWLQETGNLSTDYAKAIDESINNMDSISSWKNLLGMFGDALSDIATTRQAKQEIKVRGILDDTVNSFKSLMSYTTKNGKEVEIDCSEIAVVGRVSKIYANRVLIMSVLTNLFLNSIKSLKFVGREKPKIKIHVFEEFGNFVLTFSDNGNGISPSDEEQIWDPFFSSYKKRSNLKGWGLGMTIIKEIVEEMYKGKIKLHKTQFDYDKPGKGNATFKITIPLKELKEEK